jgi:hypothetical protein
VALMGSTTLPLRKVDFLGSRYGRFMHPGPIARQILSCTLQGIKRNRNISLWLGMPFVLALHISSHKAGC